MPDPLHPDMMVRDAAESMAKDMVRDKGRVLGGVRKLAVKNGSCFGYAAIAPAQRCPENAGFKTASGECYGAQLMAFCESPKGKHFALGSDLGMVPTADALTAAAAEIARTHERILSTLEFK